MTVKELKQKLEHYPDNMQIFLDERLSEFKYGLLNSVHRKEITFSEELEHEEPYATEEVVVLSED